MFICHGGSLTFKVNTPLDVKYAHRHFIEQNKYFLWMIIQEHKRSSRYKYLIVALLQSTEPSGINSFYELIKLFFNFFVKLLFSNIYIYIYICN